MRRLAPHVERRGHSLKILYTGPLTTPVGLLSASRKLSHLVKNADIVHAQYGSGCSYVGAGLGRVKVLSIRGSDWYGFAARRPDQQFHSWLGRRLTRHSLPHYDLVLAVSERMRDDIQRHRPDLRVEVLPSAIDLGKFTPMSRGDARERLGESDDAPWVLFSQPSRRLKRVGLAQSAVAMARRESPGLRLVLLEGRDPEEVPLWVNACDVILLSSTHEGWPNIIKEGLACGVPFTSTNVSDLCRIADLEPSCHVVPDSPDALARGLLESLRHGRNDRLRIHAQQFSLDAIADRLIGAYRDLLSPQHGA